MTVFAIMKLLLPRHEGGWSQGGFVSDAGAPERPAAAKGGFLPCAGRRHKDAPPPLKFPPLSRLAPRRRRLKCPIIEATPPHRNSDGLARLSGRTARARGCGARPLSAARLRNAGPPARIDPLQRSRAGQAP